MICIYNLYYTLSVFVSVGILCTGWVFNKRQSLFGIILMLYEFSFFLKCYIVEYSIYEYFKILFTPLNQSILSVLKFCTPIFIK